MADFVGALSVTTRLITPIPVPFAARSTEAPEGPATLAGKVQVDLAAHRAVIESTVTCAEPANFRVQPFPCPRPSATVTGNET